MKIKSIGYATLLALTTAVISGASNFLNKIAVSAVKDPIVYTTLKNFVVAILLFGLILALNKKTEIASLTKNQIYKLFAIGAIGGSLPFALFFTGLKQTSALNASLIHKTLVLWVILLAVPILKERIAAWQWVGICAIFGANLLIGGFTDFKFNPGELMILAATILWAIENVIAKTALKDISSITVAAARMIIGSSLLLLFILARGGGSAVFNLNSVQWGWTLLASLLLAGYVIAWYEALKYAPAIYVATLLVPATLVTNVLSSVFITHAFSYEQFLSSALFVTGSALMIYFSKTPQNRLSWNWTG